MGTATSKPESRRTVLAQILSRDCALALNRLKYLVSDPQDVSSALKRHGDGASFEVGELTSALHVFLRAHKNRQDTAYRGCLQVLLKAFHHSSQLDYKDEKQQTPLHIAVLYGNVFAVAALLSAGATRDLEDGECRTPEDLVAVAEYSDGDRKRVLDLLGRI
ncbi:hypothetical protein BJY04DRAFT_397 [Aspergillus karnatakaensis]|uniref:uncharacterized protein n=1 Tax=Aspergillus karnatakaensis TaxID=1810916 RepID=UPI003CCCFFB8